MVLNLNDHFNVINVQRSITRSVEAYFQNVLVFENSYHIVESKFSIFEIYCLVIAQQYTHSSIRMVKTTNQSKPHTKIIRSKLGFNLIEAIPNQEITQVSSSSVLPMPREKTILENCKMQISISTFEGAIAGALGCIFEENILKQLST